MKRRTGRTKAEEAILRDELETERVCWVCLLKCIVFILPLILIGFVSNGEFNYMRSRGYTRPLSVLQIRTDVRNKYNRMQANTLLNMLTPEGC